MMQPVRVLMAFLCPILYFSFLPSVGAQTGHSSNVTPPRLWNNSNTARVLTDRDSTAHVILSNHNSNDAAIFGFYSMDGDAFILCVLLTYEDGYVKFLDKNPPVIWSANRDRSVSKDATLNFTRGGLHLHDGDGTLVWSTHTKGRSVAGMRLEASGNLVLFDDVNTSVWQSFNHSTDSLVLGQSLYFGMNLTANVSATNWASGRFYLSAEWGTLGFYFNSVAYKQVLALSSVSNGTDISKFVSGSLGFPDPIFPVPPARSFQFMRLEFDGHLRLYETQGRGYRAVYDVLSADMELCDYPLTCGQYSVCRGNGQCSCASLSYFRPRDDQYPDAGCIPLTALSCNRMHDHQLLPLGTFSSFSSLYFQSLSIPSATEEACRQSCLSTCSCKVALFRYMGLGYSDDGYCALLSEAQVLTLRESSDNGTRAFVKIQGKSSTKRIIGIAVGSAVGSFVLFSVVLCVVIRRKCKNVEEEEYFDGIPGAPRRFTLNELTIATRNFSTRLGGGGFGSVFQGNIGDEIVAVKRLEGVEQGKEEFLAEVETIGRIHHINLVRLIGYCVEKSHRLLVYEYMCNGSLDSWIFHTSVVFTLSWAARRSIITGIARGLCYLHEECKQRIAHLDIKPQNILLDDKFNAKLSDFGLSKMINRDQSKVMTRMRGTRGYLAPEWLGSKITEKADIYSFGIVVMEIICGRENLDESQPEESIHLISMLQEKARSGQLLDLVYSASNDMRLRSEEVLEMMNLAMWCLQVDSSRRPLMSTVAKMLEGAMSLEATPDYNVVPNLASDLGANFVEPISSYEPSESHLSGPR